MGVLQNNGWLKLSLFSLIGIVIAIAILAVLSPNALGGSNMVNHTAMMQTGMMPQNNGMSMSYPMANMSNMGYGGNYYTGTDYNSYMIMRRLDMMQMQMNQMQQMMMGNGMVNMNTMNNAANMSGGNMSGMSGMGMMNMGSSGSGGMGMMMPMSGSGNMSSSGSSGSSGSSSGGGMSMD